MPRSPASPQPPVSAVELAELEPGGTAARILDAARISFAQSGIAGTGMRALADAAGVSVPTLYNHFTSKGDIVAAVFAREGIVFQALRDLPPLPERVADRLAVVAHSHFDLLQRHFELAKLVTREGMNGTPEALATSASFVDTWIGVWRDTIEGSADLRPGVDLDAAAETIKSCLWGIFSVHLAVEPGSFDPEASIAAMLTTMSAALSEPAPDPTSTGR